MTTFTAADVITLAIFAAWIILMVINIGSPWVLGTLYFGTTMYLMEWKHGTQKR